MVICEDKMGNLLENELIKYCEEGNINKVKRLVEKGADIHTQNDKALIVSCSRGWIEVVKYLIEKILPPYYANLVFFCYDNKNPESERKYLIAEVPGNVTADEGTEYTTYETVLNSAYSKIMVQFKKAVVLFAVTKVEGKNVRWTTTFGAETDL